MSTTTILPPHPPTGGLQQNKQEEAVEESIFYSGEIVLMRSRKISKEEVKRFYDLYGASLPTDVWWSYLGKDYNKNIEYCKDADDDSAYYMFHNKYIGKVKEPMVIKKNYHPAQTSLFEQRLFIVEWEVRDNQIMPGESLTRLQEHYPENLISISKMTVMTKEEILEDVLAWVSAR